MTPMKAAQVNQPRGPFKVTAMQLITLGRGLRGWPSGSAIDSQDALNFCALSGVRPMIEKFPLEKVTEAYDRMLSNKARFRVVLTLE